MRQENNRPTSLTIMFKNIKIQNSSRLRLPPRRY